MDCVTDSGDAAILYCADFCWRGIHASYCSVLTVNELAAESHSSMTRYRLSSTDDQILVEFPRLGVSGRWEAIAAPYQRVVYQSASGNVVWNCLQPRSSVYLRVGEREWTGLGYAECLTLTLPPWQLPMRQLRWGRFVSQLSVTDSEVVLRDLSLRMEESFPLRAGRLGSTILPGAPALARLLPRSLFNIEEQKWRSRGILNAHGRSSNGWVIHEVVHWEL